MTFSPAWPGYYQKESIHYILKGGRHLLDLINEVLDIARVEAGRIEMSLEPIPLDDVVQEVCALVRPLADQREVRLEDKVSVLGRNHVLADRQRLKQVLLNLLSNGIKYNRLGGQVEVSCEPRPEGRMLITVRDTGHGIAPEDLSRLFTPFDRLHATDSEIEGTGLGLVLSQRLVEAMGGVLAVESVPGQGSAFSVEFSQVASPEDALANLSLDNYSIARKQADQQYKVLCIEDNLSNLRLLEIIFQNRSDITMLTAMQGSVGLDLARQHEPDVILLDLNLPDISGKEVLARLQRSALTRDIPVIVISADATPPQSERLLESGAKAYLTKPLDIKEFLHTLDELFEGTRVLATQSGGEV